MPHRHAARRRRDSLANKAIVATTREGPALSGGRKRSTWIAAAVAVPLLAVGPGIAPRRHDGAMADVGATVLRRLTGRSAFGESFA